MKVPRIDTRPDSRIGVTDPGEMAVFIDSGAHGLYTRWVIEPGLTGKPNAYDKYDTQEFIDYLDKYAAWVKARLKHLTLYASVDVIFDPARSWKALKYLENEHGLRPLPVLHYNTPKKWIHKHLDEYPYLGIGGLGQEVSWSMYYSWADGLFKTLCPKPDCLPRWKTHGFALTAFELMRRYPWYSVDSTSWTQYAAHGMILVPPWRGGTWDYVTIPDKVFVSKKSKFRKQKNRHIDSLTPEKRKTALRYIEHLGHVLGESTVDVHGEETVTVPGVANNYPMRLAMGWKYFHEFGKTIPEWPWPFTLPHARHTKLKGLL